MLRTYLLLAFSFLVIFSPKVVKAEEGLLIINSNAQKIEFKIDIANTPESRATGLMFQKSLPFENYGMLFVYPSERELYMWMKNTYISLDMIFISESGQIIDLIENTETLSTKTLGGKRGLAVLEVMGGTVKKHGIAVGDHISHPSFKKSHP